MNKQFLLALSVLGFTTAKAQTPAHLIGRNSYEYQGTVYEIQDSSRCAYSGSRQPQMLPSLYTWNYDTATYFQKQPFGLRHTAHNIYTYDANGNPTVTETYQMISGSPVLSNRSTRTFDAANNMLTAEFERLVGATMQKQSRMTYTYNSNNRMTSMLGENWNNTTMQYVNSYRSTHTYNTAGQLENISSETYLTGWTPSYRSSYTYTGANNTGSLEETWNGTAWENGYKQMNTFDAIGNMTRSENQYWDMGAWENSYAMNYRYDANRNLLEREYLEWDGNAFLPTSTREYSYVPENYVLTEVAKTWNDIGGLYLPAAQDDSIRYYYNNSVSVGKTPAAITGISIYPSPASTQVFMQMNLTGQQQYTATLYDAAGRVVRHFANTGSGATRSAIDVHDVPAGNYVLVLQAGGTTAREKIVIAR